MSNPPNIKWRAVAAACALACPAAYAQPYPAKPVRIVIGYPAGGTVDIVARLIGQKFSESMGRTFIIDNKPGAGGNIGTDYAAKAPADGYTLLMASAAALASNPAIYAKLPFDPVRDFSPISLLVIQPNVLVVHPALPVKTVREFIALAKSRPSVLNYGSSGIGNSQHMAAELFNYYAGVKLVHVPYKGGAPALIDLVGGQIDLMFETMPTAMPYARNGKLRALGVTIAQRSQAYPDIPTIREAGLAQYEYRGWIGLLAPAGTPQDILARLNSEAVRAVNAGGLGAQFKDMAFEVVAGSPAQFGQFIKDEIALNQKIVRVSGIQPE
jgi:tripartite-type tricarboxylate transporter receptor subunit TctC